MRRLTLIAGVVCVYALQLSVQAAADSLEDFYKNKKLTMYIGSSAGGGTDIYGRIVTRFMGDHLPGKPAIVAVNLPGANGLNLVNQLYNTLPRDGTALGTFDRYMALEAIAGNPQAKFDPSKLNWIGSTNIDVSTCVTWHTTGINTLHDFMTKDVVVGSTAVYHPNILKNIFGAHLKQINGYPGGNEITLAMERGEVQGRCHWSWSAIAGTRPDWVRDKKINIIVQFAEEKHPEMPDVPLAMELARNDSDREILDLIQSSQVRARPFAAPRDVPMDRVEVLRTAFDATLADPAFRETAEKQALELEPVTGGHIQSLVERVSKTPPDVIKTFREKVMPASL